jgi:uncharacterized membrane protein
LLPEGAYQHSFKVLMALLGVATLFVAALVLVRLGASSLRLYGVLGALALAPVVIGPVSLNTYDAWPALLVAGALCALLSGRGVLSFALLGLAFTAKLYPAALLPLFCVTLWRRAGPAALGRPLLAFGIATLVVIGPFAVLGWDGLWESVEAQAGRSLQIESLGAAVLLAAHRLGLYDAEVVRGSTAALSRDLDGALPDALATATSVVQAAAIVAVVWIFVRARGDGERLVAATAATLAGFLAFTRFLSPQYLVWLLPLVPLVAPPFGVAASVVLAAALVLAQLWFFHYGDVFALERVVWLVVVRDLLLVTLYGVLLVAVARLRTTMPSSSSTLFQSPPVRSRASGTAVVEGEERRSR